ncbi:uncharacterized protein LOC133848502 [Drosophila sulfurigaster albostrigata]|uniref:uncharacterized protein LOC133848502 n=1 Tax=Drosophila sulfurigaster albostrigata TaxID=89887 RepID=UPI002D2192CE|nr:uncharacterized protein LOC133848502 [Drosophila sulfurigaster albostrigata]
MIPLSVLIFATVLFSLATNGANGSCSVQFRYPKPQMVVHFGSKHLLRETPDTLTGELYEKYDIYCKHGFQTQSYENIDGQHKELKCESNYYFYMDTPNYSTQQVNWISCSGSQSSRMFESFTKLPDCENEMTLVVGHDFKELGSLKNIAICYDLLKAKVKYVAYTAYPSKMKIIEKTQIGQLNSLGLDVEVSPTNAMFNAISTTDILNALKKDRQLKQLFGDETFEYTNLIQDNAFKGDFDESSMAVKMLNIVWLRALRSGNWRHLLNALDVANLNGKYDVRIGVSGVVKLPMLQSCNVTQQMLLELPNGDTVAVPSHIWAHIRHLPQQSEASINNATNDEFVAIAHNSPFVTNDQRQELCNSMCHEVPWLKDSLFMKLQNYPIYGVVQCCRVADVVDKLDYFPKSNGPPPSLDAPKYWILPRPPPPKFEVQDENDDEID